MTAYGIAVGDYVIGRSHTQKWENGERELYHPMLTIGTVAKVGRLWLRPSWDFAWRYRMDDHHRLCDGTWAWWQVKRWRHRACWQRHKLCHMPATESLGRAWHKARRFRSAEIDARLAEFAPGRNPLSLLGPLTLRCAGEVNAEFDVTVYAITVDTVHVELQVLPRPFYNGLLKGVRYLPDEDGPWELRLDGDNWLFPDEVEVLPAW